MNDQKRKVDTKEFELPETLFIRDIENRVFQGIVLQCLAKIEGIALVEGNFIDNIFGRSAAEGVKGIIAEQDNKNHSISIKIEVNIGYGLSIPEKAEEIQAKAAEEITKLTGLHVACIHVVFKNVVALDQTKKIGNILGSSSGPPVLLRSNPDDEYTDEF